MKGRNLTVWKMEEKIRRIVHKTYAGTKKRLFYKTDTGLSRYLYCIKWLTKKNKSRLRRPTKRRNPAQRADKKTHPGLGGQQQDKSWLERPRKKKRIPAQRPNERTHFGSKTRLQDKLKLSVRKPRKAPSVELIIQSYPAVEATIETNNGC